MAIEMKKGYSYNANPKYNVKVDVGAGATSEGVLIPTCSRLDIEVDTNVTAQVTTDLVPEDINITTYAFTGATWVDWDGTSFLSPNITGVRGVNAGSTTETLKVECS